MKIQAVLLSSMLSVSRDTGILEQEWYILHKRKLQCACVCVSVCVCVCVDRKGVCFTHKSSYCVIKKAGEENAQYLEYTSPDTLFVIGLDNYIFWTQVADILSQN